MQFGFNAPTAGRLSEPGSLIPLVVGAEAMGWDYATFSDHVVIPHSIHATYPYSDTGEFPGGAGGPRHEQLTEVAFKTAKILSTIDVLSGGRITVGIGAGWMREEFEALQAPDFDARGAVTDEYLDAFKALWTQANPSFAGKYVAFDAISFEPKPVQTPHPPIWIGGESGPALRRTVRVGDGWYPIGTNPSFPLDSLARYQTATVKVRGMAEKAGRDPSGITLAYRVARFGGPAALAGDGQHKLFTGDDGQMAADIVALRQAGVSHLDIGFPGASTAAMLEEMQRFRDKVIAQTQG